MVHPTLKTSDQLGSCSTKGSRWQEPHGVCWLNRAILVVAYNLSDRMDAHLDTLRSSRAKSEVPYFAHAWKAMVLGSTF